MKTKVWIARDKDGELYLYNNKPVLGYAGISYYSQYKRDMLTYMKIDRDSHSEITFENSPQQIEI